MPPGKVQTMCERCGDLLNGSEPEPMCDGGYGCARDPTVYACPRCDEEFETTEQCRDHIKLCKKQRTNAES